MRETSLFRACPFGVSGGSENMNGSFHQLTPDSDTDISCLLNQLLCSCIEPHPQVFWACTISFQLSTPGALVSRTLLQNSPASTSCKVERGFQWKPQKPLWIRHWVLYHDRMNGPIRLIYGRWTTRFISEAISYSRIPLRLLFTCLSGYYSPVSQAIIHLSLRLLFTCLSGYYSPVSP